MNQNYFNLMVFKSYLVYTNEAEAQGGQHLDDCRAAVVFDRVVGLQLRHYTPPAHMLPHEGTEVTHHKRTLLHLTTQDKARAALTPQITSHSPTDKNANKHLAHFRKGKCQRALL